MPQFVLNHEYVPVSCYFIENHLKEANGTFVKVYLYALNLAFTGKNVETSYIAKQLNILESDVMQAFEHWKKLGVMTEKNGVISFGEEKKSTPIQEEPKVQEERYTTKQVTEAFSKNETLKDMLNYAQDMIGKPLSPSDAQTLFWFYDNLKFTPEVILMLLEYCISKGKTRMNYIEKVAIAWHTQGVDNVEKVSQLMKNEEDKTGYIYSIRKVLGILDRSLSQSEENYLTKWHDEWGMSEEMVALAYEYCIIQTAKLSFPYMDKIIERWNKQNIRTVPDAEEDNRRFKSKNQNSAFDAYGNGYDYDELNQIAMNKLNRN